MFYLTVSHQHSLHLLYFWNVMCISSVLVKETGREMWSLSEEGVSNCVVIGLCLGPVTSACSVIFNS